MDEEDETLVDFDSNRGGVEGAEAEEQREFVYTIRYILSLFRLR